MDTVADPASRMRSYIQRVATGPELSKPLSREQTADAIEQILLGRIDPVRCAIFLIALRMKRETEDENLGALDALRKHLKQQAARAPDVLTLADPFNGYLRGLPATPFLPAVVAACGLPVCLHGMEFAGPKYGLTPHMVLAAAGKDIDRRVEQASAAIDDPGAGWTYIDQRHYHPGLHDLVSLRESMVKRCLISTLEVVLNPVPGAERSHLMTGFVHKAYPPVYADLAREAGFHSAAIVRGVEGGCIPSLSQLSRYFGFHGDDALSLYKLSPREIGIDQDERSVPLPPDLEPIMASTGWQHTEVLQPVAERTAELGLAALDNQPGPMRDSLIYAAAIALTHSGQAASLAEGADRAREVLQSGEARRRFDNG